MNRFRSVQTQQLEASNLLLVIADLPDAACDSLPKLPQAPTKNILFYITSHFCIIVEPELEF